MTTLAPHHPAIRASLSMSGRLSPSSTLCLDCGGHGHSPLTGRDCATCDGVGELAIRVALPSPQVSLFTTTPSQE